MRETGQEKLSLNGHTEGVTSVAISSDGTRIVSGSNDGTVKVWDAATGHEIFSFEGHTADVMSVAISSDDTRIVSGGVDNTVKVWDAGTGQGDTHSQRTHWLGHQRGDEQRRRAHRQLAVGDDTVKVWDVATGQEKLSLKGHVNQVFSVAISGDGTFIVSGSGDHTVKVWNAAVRQEKLSLAAHTDRVVPAWRSAATLQHAVSSCSRDKTVKVWASKTGQQMLSLEGHTEAVRSVAISSDGTRIVMQLEGESGSLGRSEGVGRKDRPAEIIASRHTPMA